jgi:hypothetical protein
VVQRALGSRLYSRLAFRRTSLEHTQSGKITSCCEYHSPWLRMPGPGPGRDAQDSSTTAINALAKSLKASSISAMATDANDDQITLKMSDDRFPLKIARISRLGEALQVGGRRRMHDVGPSQGCSKVVRSKTSTACVRRKPVSHGAVAIGLEDSPGTWRWVFSPLILRCLMLAVLTRPCIGLNTYGVCLAADE